jgi:fructose-1,6-bisphosphatase I
MGKVTTLTDFILNRQREHQDATGAFSRILNDIGLASKIIHREINSAGLTDILGVAGNVNVQGEEQQKLDIFADEQFINAMHLGGEIAAVASEEQDDILVFDDREDAKYIIAFDPLDGSSNIDVNIPVGTIFSIFKRERTGKVTLDEFLRPGKEQCCAGYVIYGSSTMLVYTTGHGVNGFTLDSTIGVFCLSHPNISIPKEGSIYSINEGNFHLYDQGYVDYINYCKELKSENKRSHTGRFIGSLVADFHRNMLKGGVFIYPGMKGAENGKLRLIYECNPMAMLAEQAGGSSSDGKISVLDIQPTELHQRIPFIVGSENKVKKVLTFL